MKRTVLTAIIVLVVFGLGFYFWKAKQNQLSQDERQKMDAVLRAEAERVMNSPEAKMLRSKDMVALKGRLLEPAKESERLKTLEAAIHILDRKLLKLEEQEAQEFQNVALSFLEKAAVEEAPKTAKSLVLAFRVLNKLPPSTHTKSAEERLVKLLNSKNRSASTLALEHFAGWKPIPVAPVEKIESDLKSKDVNVVVQALQIVQILQDSSARANIFKTLQGRVWSMPEASQAMALKVMAMNPQLDLEGGPSGLASKIYDKKIKNWEDPFLTVVEAAKLGKDFSKELEEISNTSSDSFSRDRAKRLLSLATGRGL